MVDTFVFVVPSRYPDVCGEQEQVLHLLAMEWRRSMEGLESGERSLLHCLLLSADQVISAAIMAGFLPAGGQEVRLGSML